MQPNEITIKQIMERADVGMGTVNYHFGSKENLMNLVIRRYISSILPETPRIFGQYADLPPLQQFRAGVKDIMTIIAREPEIARQAFMQDMTAGFEGDATSETIQALLAPLRSALGDEDETRLWLRLHLLVVGLEATVLRSEIVRKASGLHFEDDGEREEILDAILDMVLAPAVTRNVHDGRKGAGSV